MSNKKTKGTKSRPGSATVDVSVSEAITAEGDQPWRKWTVKPFLEPIPTVPPEKGIGDRIAYCRGQLNNLSLEALARYAKHFDSEGISRQSLLRYESGDTLPGARELRILCDTLWVPITWLLTGVAMEDQRSQTDALLHAWLKRTLLEMGAVTLPPGVLDLEAKAQKEHIEQRQRWIHEARQPQSR